MHGMREVQRWINVTSWNARKVKTSGTLKAQLHFLLRIAVRRAVCMHDRTAPRLVAAKKMPELGMVEDLKIELYFRLVRHRESAGGRSGDSEYGKTPIGFD